MQRIFDYRNINLGIGVKVIANRLAETTIFYPLCYYTQLRTAPAHTTIDKKCHHRNHLKWKTDISLTVNSLTRQLADIRCIIGLRKHSHGE